MEFTRIENVLLLDEELAELRAVALGTKIELYYPAFTITGNLEYVNVDKMPEKVEMTFSQLLEQNAGRRVRRQ